MSDKIIKVSAHGFIKKEDKILVTQRPLDDDYMPGFWDTPGGTIEFGEKCTDGLVREIKEETGLIVKVGKIIYCFDHLSNPQRHQFTLVYECEYIEGEINLDPKEHQQFKWLTLNEINKLPQKIHFLEDLIKYLQK